MERRELLLFKKSIDAPTVTRGFLFQYLRTLEIWLSNYIDNSDYEIFCETEDDIKLINERLKLMSFSQVKCYSSVFKLNDVEIEKSLYNFYILYMLYKHEYNCTYMFETNTCVANSDSILKEWVDKQDELTDELAKKYAKEVASILLCIIETNTSSEIRKIEEKITKTKKMISKNPLKEKVLKKKIEAFSTSIEEINIIKCNIEGSIKDNDNFITFVKKIRWNFANIESEKSIEALKNNIRALISKISSANRTPNIMLARLLSIIYEKSSSSNIDERCLNNILLLKVINETNDEMISNTNSFIVELLDTRIDSLENMIKNGFDRIVNNKETLVNSNLIHYEKLMLDEMKCIERRISGNKVLINLPAYLYSIIILLVGIIIFSNNILHSKIIHSYLVTNKNLVIDIYNGMLCLSPLFSIWCVYKAYKIKKRISFQRYKNKHHQKKIFFRFILENYKDEIPIELIDSYKFYEYYMNNETKIKFHESDFEHYLYFYFEKSFKGIVELEFCSYLTQVIIARGLQEAFIVTVPKEHPQELITYEAVINSYNMMMIDFAHMM